MKKKNHNYTFFFRQLKTKKLVTGSMTFDLSWQLVSNTVRGRFITQHMAELHRFVATYIHTHIKRMSRLQ